MRILSDFEKNIRSTITVSGALIKFKVKAHLEFTTWSSKTAEVKELFDTFGNNSSKATKIQISVVVGMLLPHEYEVWRQCRWRFCFVMFIIINYEHAFF